MGCSWFRLRLRAVTLAACGPPGPSNADIMAGFPARTSPSGEPSTTPGPTPIGPTSSQGEVGIPVNYGLAVLITSAGDRKISVIRAVRSARTEMGLAEAKALVESPNAVVASGLSAADATALQNGLHAAGATVSVQ